jgi:WD40 repeat protein
MSSTSKPKIEKSENSSKKEKDHSKKPTVKIELFPPLDKKPEAPKTEILIENSCVFPKVGMVGKSEQITFIGHPKPVIKIILIKTSQYPNHLCSLSIDGKIKFWKLNDNNKQKCLKSIDANFEAWDILLGNNNNLIVCGEAILMINLENDERIIIKEKKYYKYVDFNLLARINNDLGVCTSLNDYYLILDLNKGSIIKQIEFDKSHFICRMERDQKMNKEKSKQKKENEEDEEEDNNANKDNLDDNKKEEIKNEIQKMIRDLGSGKCKEYEGGHKGHVHALLGINTEKFKDSIISGGEDNLIKIININNPKEVITLSGHHNTIESLVLDNLKEYLYSGSLDYTIKKWDLNTKDCIITMGFNNAFQTLLLYLDNNYLLSVGVNSKVKLWNENCLNVKSYKYSHAYIKSGVMASYEKEYNKAKIIFGDDKGNIFMKQFIIGEDNINKYNEYLLSKTQKENEEKSVKTKGGIHSKKSNNKLIFKNEDLDKNYHFKESTYETENTDV